MRGELSGTVCSMDAAVKRTRTYPQRVPESSPRSSGRAPNSLPDFLNRKNKMLIIPAIDLKDGKCVRLRQGRMEDSTVFGDDPIDMTTKWVNAGARRLHLVDLKIGRA